MLILSRKKEESIIIGKDIEIVVIGIEGDQVKLGINAPRSVEVYRKEVYLAIQNENKQAANQAFDIADLEKLLKEKNK
ncbi:MAG: carbon storage regulator CsrA [Vulcanibacillus sp.]